MKLKPWIVQEISLPAFILDYVTWIKQAFDLMWEVEEYVRRRCKEAVLSSAASDREGSLHGLSLCDLLWFE